MAARRGKSQARRNGGNNSGLPGWAWLILGLLLGIGLLLAAPKFLKSDGDGFFRPRPNPDARPAGGTVTEEDEMLVPEGDDAPRPVATTETPPKEPDFDFYTVLPGEEVAMTDAQLAATAREERERQTRLQREQQAQQQAGQAVGAAPSGSSLPPPVATETTPTSSASTLPATTTTTPAASATTAARYILQAGAFGASGDAEELKAKIALLGLGARVESANINGKTMYRVRMGPYGTASELAEAKAKLGSNGLPAMAIKAK
ncbi:MAG: SPOR domain-containing protein [Lysobacter sp.]|nr:SPOR domain-containing protein [Lysobacter sp.]